MSRKSHAVKRRRDPLRAFSRLARVPADLDSVTERGTENPEREAGLRKGSAEALWQRLRELYATGVQPGLQLCVRHRGKVVLNRAIGYARGAEPGAAGKLVPMRVDTPINLFSAAKAVTAMLVHKLQELGKLDIDDAVAAYIPGFERHGKGAITVRQVLTHRAGLQRLPVLASEDALGLLADPAAIAEMIADLKPAKIGGAPAYHAVSGGFILAEVMRRATGREPRALLDELLKKPLGARWLDFGVAPQDAAKVAHNMDTGFAPGPIGWQLANILGVPLPTAVRLSNDPRFLTALVPSANVIATAHDVAAFYQCLVDEGRFGGHRVFEADTVRRAVAPDRAGASIDRVIGIPIRYSPGFMVGHRGLGLYGWNRTSTFGHLGLSSTFTWARPDTGTAVALITNGKPILGPHLREMVAVFTSLNAFCENKI